MSVKILTNFSHRGYQVCFFLFFFQAEDGIRDYKVTGVQTCALPILEVLGAMNGDVAASEKVAIRKSGTLIGDIRTAGIVIDDDAYFKGKIDIVAPEHLRSEERRVGKECRSRWSPYH